MMKNEPHIITFPIHGDDRGKLVVTQSYKDIPFDIKRVFYIYNTLGDTVRGKHANRESEFVMIAVCGSCKIRVCCVCGEETFELSSADKGLFLPKMSWKEMYDFSDDCVLMVIASTCYDSNEYIRDFGDFQKELDLLRKRGV